MSDSTPTGEPTTPDAEPATSEVVEEETAQEETPEAQPDDSDIADPTPSFTPDAPDNVESQVEGEGL